MGVFNAHFYFTKSLSSEVGRRDFIFLYLTKKGLIAYF